jgi:TolB-like protein/Flp pilus assembly protein TadD
MPDSAHTGTPHGAVFLSYASQDADAARRISEALRSHGVEVWFDADGGLEHGDAWDSKIRQQIKECLLFIPIISSSTQARHEGYFRIEWDLAAERARGIASGVPFILPVVTDQTTQEEALVPDRFKSVQWTTLPGGVVTPDYLARFLKLWSHRSGLAAAASARPAEAPPPGRAAAVAPTPRPKGRLGPVLIALAVVSVAAVTWLALSRRGTSTAASPVAAAQAPSQPSVSQSSVAVLAFENLSDDKENEYFSDGISEELLNVLSKVPGLRVAARTSAFSFKGKNATAQEIGAKLGVANLVEGSVRRVGNSVRIAARLSRVETGEQLWSESYTRDLKDVFAVQTELAQTIVEQLRNRLGIAQNKEQILAQVKKAARGGTTNVEAHQLYLQGNYLLHNYSLDAFRHSIELFRKAVELDPGFVLGWAQLSNAAELLSGYAPTADECARSLVIARDAAERATTLDPDLPAAELAKMGVQMAGFNWNGALESVERAKKGAPESVDVIRNEAKLLFRLGRLDRSLELVGQVEELDPVDSEIRVYKGFILHAKGRMDEALGEFRIVLELSPDAVWGHAGLSQSFIFMGRMDEALKEALLEKTEWTRYFLLGQVYWALGRKEEADGAMAKLIDTSANVAAYQVAEVYSFRGEADQAFAWLDRAFRQKDPGLGWMKSDVLFDKQRSDPRWNAILHKVGLADDQLR